MDFFSEAKLTYEANDKVYGSFTEFKGKNGFSLLKKWDNVERFIKQDFIKNKTFYSLIHISQKENLNYLYIDASFGFKRTDEADDGGITVSGIDYKSELKRPINFTSSKEFYLKDGTVYDDRNHPISLDDLFFRIWFLHEKGISFFRNFIYKLKYIFRLERFSYQYNFCQSIVSNLYKVEMKPFDKVANVFAKEDEIDKEFADKFQNIEKLKRIPLFGYKTNIRVFYLFVTLILFIIQFNLYTIVPGNIKDSILKHTFLLPILLLSILVFFDYSFPKILEGIMKKSVKKYIKNIYNPKLFELRI